MDFDILGLLRALGDAAGWTVAVVILVFGVVAFYRGWVVPGYIYNREVARGERAEDAVDASNKTTEQAAAATRAATDAALAVANQLVQLQDVVRDRDRAPS